MSEQDLTNAREELFIPDYEENQNREIKSEQIEEQQVDDTECDSRKVQSENKSSLLCKLQSFFLDVKTKLRKIKFIDDWFNLSQFQRKKKTKKAIKVSCISILWFFGLMSLFLCMSNLYQQAFNPGGYTGFFNVGQAVVASNSMDNASYTINGEVFESKNPIKQNDWIFYKHVNADDIKVGDVVIYRKCDNSGESLIVHRVIKINEKTITTKGDRNAVQDADFGKEELIGKYMFKLNGIGALLNLLSTPWLFAMILITILAFVGGKVLWYYLHKKTVINAISTRSENKDALDRFFDI